MDDIFLYFMYPTAYICLQNKFGGKTNKQNPPRN